MNDEVIMVSALFLGCAAQALVIKWDYKLESGFNWLSGLAAFILLITLLIGLYALTTGTRLAATDYYSIQAALLSLLGSVWAAVVAVGLHKGTDQDQSGTKGTDQDQSEIKGTDQDHAKIKGLEARIDALEKANVQSQSAASKFYQVAVILFLSVISATLGVVV